MVTVQGDGGIAEFEAFADGLTHLGGGQRLLGAEVGGVIAVGLEDRTLAEAHRAVLVNVIARCVPEGLPDIAEVLGAVDNRSAGFGLASVLADLALTRYRMLDELAEPPVAES